MKEIVIIGIDGGASKMNAWNILFDKKNSSFRIGHRNYVKNYHNYVDYDVLFKPVPIQTQLKEINSGIRLTEIEKRQSKAYLNACLDIITSMASPYKNHNILIGLGMPGLKSNDLRGIIALANGPRMPEFATEIETELKLRKIDLLRPIARLGSDADYCGMGEEHASEGLFRSVKNAYYFGGGTGVADALKLKGNLISFDQAGSWIAKTWEMLSPEGVSLEKCISARAIQLIYGRLCKIQITELDQKKIFGAEIMSKALSHDPYALKTFERVSRDLAALLFERISTIHSGYQQKFAFVDPSKTIKLIRHPYYGTLLDRIIFGQRMGNIIEQSKGKGILWEPLLENLTKFIQDSNNAALQQHYLSDDMFNASILQISNLREAPVIGAGADAFLMSLNSEQTDH
jgi:hypothetical protein